MRRTHKSAPSVYLDLCFVVRQPRLTKHLVWVCCIVPDILSVMLLHQGNASKLFLQEQSTQTFFHAPSYSVQPGIGFVHDWRN